MKSQNINYSNYDKNLKKEEEILDSIFQNLTKNREEKKSLKKLEQLIKSKLDIKNLLPCSKSFEGANLLTLSKFWMILILIKITKGKKQQDDFLTLINSSLTHDLNEYEEYLQFFEEQCEQLFSDEEAIDRINSNPQIKTKLEKPSEHEEIRSNYIYLLFRPNYFQKIQLEGISKTKKLEKKSNKGKSKSRSINKSKSGKDEIIYLNDSEESDEKGDRLDENDMISKIKEIKKNKNRRGKSKTSSFKKKKEEDDDEENEEKGRYKNKKMEKNSSSIKIDRRRKKKEKNEDDEEINSDNEKEKSSSKDTYKKRGRKPKNKNEEKNEKGKKDKNNNYNKNHKNKIDSIDSEESENSRPNPKKEKEKEKKPRGRPKSRKNNVKDDIINLLGLQLSDSSSKKSEKTEKSDKKSKRSSSVSLKKKESKKNVKDNKDKKKSKSIIKYIKKQKPKEEEFEDEEEEDEFGTSSSELNDSQNIYEDDLEKLNDEEKKQMQKDIQAALKGNFDEEDIKNLLGDSKMEGISLDHFNSESDMDLDDY